MNGSRGGERRRICFLIADIAAMIVFSTSLCMVIEIFVAGSRSSVRYGRERGRSGEPRHRKAVRMVPGQALPALGIDRANPWKLVFGDTLAFVVFQVPLYVVVLLSAGATWSQIAVSSLSMSLVFSLAGRPYGVFLDFCRRRALEFFG